MSGLCENCRWWDQDKDEVPDHREDWGICTLTQNIGMHAFTHPDSLALAMGTGYFPTANLATSPNFGCVQHEAAS